MTFLFSSPKVKKATPVIISEPSPPPTPPPAPTKVTDTKIAKLDILEKEKRRRARAASQVTTPGLLRIKAPTERPMLKGVLG